MKKWNTEIFMNYIKEEGHDEYELLSEYKMMNQHVKIKHNVCGNEYLVTPAKFTLGRRCPYCAGKKKLSINEIKQNVFIKTNGEYEVLSNTYIGTHKPLIMRHNVCGKEFRRSWNDFDSKISRCPYCAPNRRITQEMFDNMVKDLVCGEYIFLDAYKNTKTHINVKHNSCGNIYSVTPEKFLDGRRCPFCSHKNSSNELFISKYLKENNIKYNYQVKISDCADLQSLPFDFEILKENGERAFLLEYDGEQHFKPMGFNNSKVKFETTQLHDKIKDEYCKNNNIILIRIKYTENLQERLDEIFSKNIL